MATDKFGIPEPLPQVYNRFDPLFLFANVILNKGSEAGRKLSEADINNTDVHDIPAVARDALQVQWRGQAARGGKPSLSKCMWSAWWQITLYAAVFHFLEVMSFFISPVLIREIVDYVDATVYEQPSVVYGLWLAGLFFMTPLLTSMFQSQFTIHCRRHGLRAASALACLVFEKVLKITQPVAASYGPGTLANIMQVDCYRFQWMFFQMNFVWSMPLMLFIGVGLLYNNIGWASVTPLLIMVSTFPLNKFLVKRLMNLSRNVSKARDARIKILTEVIHASRLVKMLAWEHQISDLVVEKRNAEMLKLSEQKLFEMGNGLVWTGVPCILPLVTFGVYVAAGGKLQPGLVFSSLALIDLVRIPMNLFPQSLTVITQVLVGMYRIEALLFQEEVRQFSPAEADAHAASTQMPVYVRSGSTATSSACTSAATHEVALVASDRGSPVISHWSAGPAVRIAGAEFRWATPSAEDENAASSGLANRGVETSRRCCGPRSSRFWRRDGAVPLLPAGGARGDVEQGMSMVEVQTSTPPTLRIGNFEVSQGKLVMVVGPVGSGKSTLLAGLLNEVPQLSGCVGIQGPVSYCAQVPWIVHGTVRDNILLGDEMDEQRFKEALFASALDTDLDELRDGRETVIGERGINLSGGQKARVSLARAIYKHTSSALYLLDDPLSAVDMHVARHLMEECIGSEKGLLRSKTRILVTHQAQFMHMADIVAILKDGELVACRPAGQLTAEELESFGLQATSPAVEDKGRLPTLHANALSKAGSPPSGLPKPALVRSLSHTSDMGAAAPKADWLPWENSAWGRLESDGGVGDMDFGAPRVLLNARRRRSHALFRGRQVLMPPNLVRALSDMDPSVPEPMKFERALSSPPTDSFIMENAEPPVGSASPEAAVIDLGPSADAVDGLEAGAPEASNGAEGAEGATNTDVQARDDGSQEEMEVGALSLRVWLAYARAMGRCVALILGTAYIMTGVTQLGSTLWLAAWSEKEATSTSAESTLISLGVYALISLGTVACIGCRIFLFRLTSLKVSRTLHDQALTTVLRSPMSWLDTTPAGRIINRFAQDLQRVDTELQNTTSYFVDCVVNLVMSMLIIGIYMPVVILMISPLFCIYIRVQDRFRRTAREIQRMASANRSPIFQGLDEAINGVTTIRAFEQQSFFVDRNAARCALSSRLDFTNVGNNRWLTTRMKLIGTVPVAVVVTCLVMQGHLRFLGLKIQGALAALILRYTLQLTNGVEGLLQSLTQTELCLVALERISGFCRLDQEPPLTLPVDEQLAGWPSAGEVRFEDVTMRYRRSLPTVLNGISFTVSGGTSLGVVGRTGAGKSSLLQALFRLCPLEGGCIRIDGRDIWKMGLHTLRRRLAIIPQDPLGFTGTMRFNLDPFGEHGDGELLAELEKVQLQEFVTSKEEGLDYYLTAGGENLSVGQRQLVCAARAFLRQSPILILDEATAAVDFQTDNLIQEVLRNEVATRKLTTVTIAHRINTILCANNVLVMDKGKAAEFGPTQQLASDPTSVFFTFIDSKKGSRSH